MKRLTSALLVFAAVVLGQTAHAAWWQSTLICDSGAAVVDIDLGERRHTQLVIRDANIISHFNNSGAALTGTSWLVWDGRLHNLTNNAHETVVPGEMGSGVFHPSQFQGFTSPVSYSGRQFYVYRQGIGLKVEVVVPGHSEYCGGDWNSGGGCNNPVPAQSEQKLANWYFQNCSEAALP